MKKIRNLSANRPFAIFLCAAVLFATSCSKNNENANTVVKSSISGEQMFREIFLFQGSDVEKKIPVYAEIENVLNNETDAEKASVAKFDDQIVASVKASNPAYFDELKAVVESKSLYNIRQEMLKGGSMIIASLENNANVGPLITSVKAAADDIKDNYNLNDKGDIQKFSDNIKSKILTNDKIVKQLSATANPSVSACLAVFAVVALAIWEAGAAVNVIAVATVGFIAAAVAIYKAKVITSAAAPASLGIGSLSNDQVALSISNNY